MGAVYRLSIRQLAGRWRLAIMAVLSLMPVAMSAMMVSDDSSPSVVEFETAILGAMLAGSISPLVVLAIAVAAFGNEIEDRTLANLTLSPLPRWQIVLPKLLATLTVAAPFVTASALATSYIAFLGDPRAVAAVVASALLGVTLYASVFVWLGLVSTQAIGVGLLYIVLWEGLLSGFVSGVRLLSIRHYAIAVMHGLDERRFATSTHPSLTVALGIAAVVVAGLFLLSVRRLRRMDVP